MGVLSDLEPKRVFEIFEELCAIPHGSTHTKAISDWCVEFGKKLGLEHYQDTANNVILIAPATPCPATLIGQDTIRINGEDLPTRANMGMLTQPISFLGLPVVTVPVTTSAGLPIGLQLIAPPWREDLCLRAARALELQGIVNVSSSPVMPA